MHHAITAWKLSFSADDSAFADKISLTLQPVSLDEGTRQLPGGAYTTFRTFERYQVLRLNDHFNRLEETARLSGISVRLNRDAVVRALHQALTDYPADEMRVRMILDLEQTPGTIYFLIEALMVPNAQDYQRGVKVVTRPMHRQNPKAKLTGFIETAAEVRHSLPSGVNEAVMIGQDGRVLEGLSSNFFAVKNETVWTAEQGVLSGITRQMVLDVIRAQGLSLRLVGVGLDDLTGLNEAFLTSASRAVLPVTEIDGKPVGNGLPGPVTRRLMDGYQAEIQKDLDTV